jgi:primosomal protein N' (replication factor Y)
MIDARRLVRVAVAVPLADAFDYLWEEAGAPPAPGCRVRVPFGRGERIGIVLGHPSETELPQHKLKAVREALDARPVFGPELIATLCWAADYYHHPIGEVLSHALPAHLRDGRAATPRTVSVWSVTETGLAESLEKLAKRAPKQAAALDLLRSAALTDPELGEAGIARDVARRLLDKGWVRCDEQVESMRRVAQPFDTAPVLTSEQRAALDEIAAAPSGF